MNTITTDLTSTAPDYRAKIAKQLSIRYKGISPKETAALCREVIFAPESYITEINQKPVPISNVRENLAEMIENSTSEKNFIPYSLDSEIADLIEYANCETSSMNEYYRWISATADILKKTSDNSITYEDLAERKEFLNMSVERETEILLCLALYEGAGLEKNKEKIELLYFKLARLREMRSIVRNTPSRISPNNIRQIEQLKANYAYCCDLLTQKYDYSPNFNLKLNLNINHNSNQDLEENSSWLAYLRQMVLYMMRELEDLSLPNTRSEHTAEKETGPKCNAKVPARDSQERQYNR